MAAEIARPSTQVSDPPASLVPVKAVVFDILGTTVDWASTVINAFNAHAPTGEAAQYFDATEIAYAWRNEVNKALKEKTDSFNAPPQRYRKALDDICAQRNIGLDIWSDEVRIKLVESWRGIQAWVDTPQGFELLRSKYIVVGLTNGAASTMVEIHKRNEMVFDLLLTADIVGAFKPDPLMYKTTLRVLGLQPGEIAMVASHSYDLRAAREHGYRTIYIERAAETKTEPENSRNMDVLAEEFDLLIRESPGNEQGGLVELARKLGVNEARNAKRMPSKFE